MKNTYVALLTTALLGFGSIAVADEPVKGPMILTDSQMSEIVAGEGGACCQRALRITNAHFEDVLITHVGDNTIKNWGRGEGKGVADIDDPF